MPQEWNLVTPQPHKPVHLPFALGNGTRFRPYLCRNGSRFQRGCGLFKNLNAHGMCPTNRAGDRIGRATPVHLCPIRIIPFNIEPHIDGKQGALLPKAFGISHKRNGRTHAFATKRSIVIGGINAGRISRGITKKVFLTRRIHPQHSASAAREHRFHIRSRNIKFTHAGVYAFRKYFIQNFCM